MKHNAMKMAARVLRRLGYKVEYELRLTPTRPPFTVGVLMGRSEELEPLLMRAGILRINLLSTRHVTIHLKATALDVPGQFMGQDMTDVPGLVVARPTEWIRPGSGRSKIRGTLKVKAEVLPPPGPGGPVTDADVAGDTLRGYEGSVGIVIDEGPMGTAYVAHECDRLGPLVYSRDANIHVPSCSICGTISPENT